MLVSYIPQEKKHLTTKTPEWVNFLLDHTLAPLTRTTRTQTLLYIIAKKARSIGICFWCLLYIKSTPLTDVNLSRLWQTHIPAFTLTRGDGSLRQFNWNVKFIIHKGRLVQRLCTDTKIYFAQACTTRSPQSSSSREVSLCNDIILNINMTMYNGIQSKRYYTWEH